MKRINNRGFILTETIIVSGIILIAFGLLYSQFFTLFARYETIEKYDTIDGIYSAKQVKNLIQENSNSTNFFVDMNTFFTTNTNHYYDITACPILNNQPYCVSLLSALNVKRAIVTRYNLTDVKNFNAYTNDIEFKMQEYIKYLPAGNESANNGYRIILAFNDGTYSSIDIINDNIASYSGMSFNGYTDNVEINIDIPETCTIEMWAKGETFTDKILFSLNGNSYPAGPDLYFKGNNFYLNIGDSQSNPFSGSLNNLSLNTWNHYAVTFDKINNTSKLYINGNYVGSANYRNPKSNKLLLGKYNDDFNYNWKGNIKEVRVWNAVRTQDEIQQNLNKSINKSSNSLIGYYQLYNNPTDVVMDASGNNNNGIAYSHSRIGGLSFDGIDDYVYTYGVIGNTITIEAWAYANDYVNMVGGLERGRMLWSFDANDFTWGPDLYFYGNTISLNASDSSGNTNPFKNNNVNVAQPSLYEWHHYAVTLDYSKTEAKLYIDGKYAGSATYKNPASSNPTPTLFIGRLDMNSDYNWNGYVKEFRVWNSVRSATEIKENMNKTIPLTASYLRIYYPFVFTVDETSNPLTQVYNRASTGGFTGLVSGATLRNGN